jgi:hypothetical protein
MLTPAIGNPAGMIDARIVTTLVGQTTAHSIFKLLVLLIVCIMTIFI